MHAWKGYTPKSTLKSRDSLLTVMMLRMSGDQSTQQQGDPPKVA